MVGSYQMFSDINAVFSVVLRFKKFFYFVMIIDELNFVDYFKTS